MIPTLKRILLGAPLDPMSENTRHRLTLVALLAWIGLGADALSSSCYGPEEAYLALGANNHLAIFISLLTVITVFIISLGYNQVIELFPGGGGGYKVATRLLHPYVGLVAGAALIVDYILTIAISIASGSDAIFSFLPLWMSVYKLPVELGFVIALMWLNLRGMKEAIIVLLPIFMGFLLTHIFIIIYGIAAHAEGLLLIIPDAMHTTKDLAATIGIIPVIGLVLHSYSLGSGTYTGIEAISNNVQHFAHPKVQTAKRSMFYMALSLSFVAGGFILLYLLWHAQPVPGKTLNAVVFSNILGDSWSGQSMMVLLLQLEAGLLFVAANAGFAAGPSVLANMAADNWLPKRFRFLSNRLVVQNGIFLFGAIACIVLAWTKGAVSLLVVLYSINVFITFTLSLMGVSLFWIRHRRSPSSISKLMISGSACLLTGAMLCTTIFYKFTAGGWATLLLTTFIILVCFFVNRHYRYVESKLNALDNLLCEPLPEEKGIPQALNPLAPTAVIFVNTLSVGMHTLLSVRRLFSGKFENFVFVSVGEVDVESYRGEYELEQMEKSVNQMLDYFVKYCGQYQIPAEAYSSYGTDAVRELENLTNTVGERYPNAIYFTSRLIFSKENSIKWYLHNQTPLLLQEYMHLHGKELMILPMKLES